jgi:hypothetical protein
MAISLLFPILALVTYVSVVRAGTRNQPFRETWPLYVFALTGAAVVTLISFTVLN